MITDLKWGNRTDDFSFFLPFPGGALKSSFLLSTCNPSLGAGGLDN